jgi:hypothetical protein
MATGQIGIAPQSLAQGTNLAVETVLSVRSNILGPAVALAGVLGFGVASASAADPTPAHPLDPCFAANQWTDWKSPSPNVIYLKVDFNRVYRLDLSAGSSELQDPDVHLVSKIRGSDWICSPLDLDLEVADLDGIREALIVKAITPLTPDEVKAIPPKYRP